MAFNFNPAGIKTVPRDYSWISNLPKDFWQGQAVGRENSLRNDVDSILKNGGTWDDVVKRIASSDPQKGAALNIASQRSEYNQQGVYGTPVYGIDNATGESVVGYGRRDGGGVAWSNGSGQNVTPTKGVQFLNQGTQFTPTDRLNGQVLPGSVPINNAEKQRQEEAGTGQGKAQVNLPSAENAASRMFRQLDGLSNDPYLPSMTGYNAYKPNISPDSKRITSKVQQITAGTFLQQYETLRGAGQISDAEGARADAAISRLQQLGVDDAGYKAALTDVRREIANLLQVAKAKASGIHEMPATNPGELPVYDSPQGGDTQRKVYDIDGNPVE